MSACTVTTGPGELGEAIGHGTAVVVERHGRITGYASVLGFFGHAVADSNTDLQAMIAAADGLRRSWPPRPDAQQRSFAMVPGERLACGAAAHAVDDRPPQRA